MILTVARDEGLRVQVVAALRDTGWGTGVVHVPSAGEAQEMLRGPGAVTVVLVGPSIGLEGAREIAATASAQRQPPAILLVGDVTNDMLRAAMRAGIRDVLPRQFSDDELRRALEEAGVDGDGPPPLDGFTVAVFSTKGGVGTSVVAANLAVRLADRTGESTTLVDLDLASADQAIMHGQSPRWTIQDLADGSVGKDPESLRQVLVQLPGSSSRLLSGPVDPALAETVTGTQVAAIVAAVRAEAPIAVLDTASAFDDRTLAALDAADIIVVTSSLDVAALRALTVSLETLRRLGIEEDRLCLALVRSDSKSGLLLSDVEAAIDRPIDVGIPSTRAVPQSVNEGVPLAVSSPRSGVVVAIDEIIQILLDRVDADVTADVEQSGRSGGLFPWSKRSRKQATKANADADRGNEDATEKVASSPEVAGEDASAPPEPAPTPPKPADNVLSIDGRRDESADQPQRRVVKRTQPAAPADGGGSADDDQAEPASVKDLPPPQVVVDGDDEDEPRRRRRR